MKAALFDLDGTLVDSSEGILGSLRHMLAELGLADPGDTTLRSWIGPPLQQGIGELLGTEDPQRIERAVGIYRARYRDWGVHQTRLFEGMSPLLHELHRAGVLLGVATSKPTEFAQAILDSHQLTPLLGAVSGADWEGRLTKTDLVAATARQLRCAAEATVVVGDRRYDVLGAHENEMSSAAVTYGFGTRAELEQAGADIVCDTVEQLAAALRSFFDIA